LRSELILSPAGTKDNSPQFQLRDKIKNEKAPKGRQKFSFVPSGLDSLAYLPAVKTAGYFQLSLRDSSNPNLAGFCFHSGSKTKLHIRPIYVLFQQTRRVPLNENGGRLSIETSLCFTDLIHCIFCSRCRVCSSASGRR
jgi:hypothetical protein